MADSAVAPVEAGCVDAVQLAHGHREIRVRCLNQQMEVVAHQAVGVAETAVASDDPVEVGEQPPPVSVVPEDRRALVSTRDRVVDGVLELDPQRSRHRLTLRTLRASRKMA
jgi:hypothetical protein